MSSMRNQHFLFKNQRHRPVTRSWGLQALGLALASAARVRQLASRCMTLSEYCQPAATGGRLDPGCQVSDFHLAWPRARNTSKLRQNWSAKSLMYWLRCGSAKLAVIKYESTASEGNSEPTILSSG